MIFTPDGQIHLTNTQWAQTRGTTVAFNGQCCTSKGNVALDMEYRYTVQGKEYTSKRISFSGEEQGYVTQDQARKIPHQAGAPVTVFYSPGNSHFATLVPKQDANLRPLFGVTEIAVLTTLLLLGGLSWLTYRNVLTDPDVLAEADTTPWLPEDEMARLESSR